MGKHHAISQEPRENKKTEESQGPLGFLLQSHFPIPFTAIGHIPTLLTLEGAIQQKHEQQFLPSVAFQGSARPRASLASDYGRVDAPGAAHIQKRE